MNIAFIVIPMLCYACQSWVNIQQGDYPHAFVWATYSMGNLGFVWYELTK